MVTNSKLNLFLIENPDLKDMVFYLAECPKNVLMTLEYSDFFYEKADSLLMSGLIELHGDKIFMPIYDVFEDMEDDLVEALEVAPLTSIVLIPYEIINGRILTLYAKECLIQGFDKLNIPSEMLLYYYDIAADDFDFNNVEAFNILWNFDNSDIKMKLLEKFLQLLRYEFRYDNKIMSTLIEFFKYNYYRNLKINGELVRSVAYCEGSYKDTVNEMEYIDIYKNCSSIEYKDIRWLLKRLFKKNLLNLFEMLVLQVSWKDTDFACYDYDKKMMKKIKRILRKARRKKHENI